MISFIDSRTIQTPGVFSQMEPFRLQIPEQAVSDLHQRLANARLPDQAPDAPWTYGSDVSFVSELCEYWRTGFDWRAQEQVLNQYEQYKVQVDNIDLHFIRVAGVTDDSTIEPMPLLLSHGWPGSVFEFPKLIARLTNPTKFGFPASDAFTVVAPSLPGYTLSFSPNQRRVSIPEMASCFGHLMTDILGYSRFAVQGGDWGSFVSTLIAHQFPDNVVGAHLNMLPLRRDSTYEPQSPAEAKYLNEELPLFMREETGYQWIQGTKPQTLAFGLNDSPLGLAAWMVEKFRSWTDCQGDPLSALSADEMLANISLYWFTGCIGSSFWPYYDRRHNQWPIAPGETIDVPVGYAEFPHELFRPPQSLAQRQYSNIQRWQEMPRGGHFAALEQPDLLAEEIRTFFRPLRTGSQQAVQEIPQCRI